jgi:hypothetical protein
MIENPGPRPRPGQIVLDLEPWLRSEEGQGFQRPVEDDPFEVVQRVVKATGTLLRGRASRADRDKFQVRWAGLQA